MGERVGLYPGTFDPITNGHLDIVERAAAHVVDRLIIAVAINVGKTPIFTFDERVAMVEAETAPMAKKYGIEIEARGVQGLLVETAKECGASMLIRGLRAVSDFDYEFQMASMNRQLEGEVETVFLMASERYQFIASSLVKEVCQLGGNIDPFVPAAVASALKTKLDKK
ncbi:MAG: pantetheine-phosphate adenylyltransferase [Rhodospirillaceae bacterium]|nr:pantetheine-phosphate adenylyltransferase [Rhodospirillaceae bacterium]HAA90924.1 pantetheine-phosphate adenylyltransferase [Rhodospirillaceae bacterium]